jgi:proton-dependent oligopeptide transporter, POT family
MASTSDHSGWMGHPRGLSTLFFTEMWERFSYYGMRAFLILYMVAPVTAGGLGFSDVDAASIYGTYTGSAWGAAILGGLVADRWLGQYRSVLLGGIVIALGHFTLAFQALPFFYSGLALIALGTGLLKPNVSTIVGALYQPGDTRRDAGFSIFYMGINLGAFIGPLIAGYLAQRVDWHVGFAAAGVGMTAGVIQYVLGKRPIQSAVARLKAAPATTPASVTVATGAAPRFGPVEWRRIAAICVFFIFASLFWGAFEQAGSTLNLFADRYTRLSMLGFEFPSSWLQSVPPVCVILLAPVFGWLWIKLGPREPSSPAKFAWGLFFASLAFFLLVPAGAIAQSGDGIRVSPWWLIGSYVLVEMGELCLSPVGLSVVTKLSPARIVGLMMGVFFLSNSVGNKLAGWTAGFFSALPLPTLFGAIAMVMLVSTAIMVILVRPVRRLMGGVH